MGMWDMPARHYITDTELRFNPYHDPQNGRFTTAGGGSGGGFLYSKGGKSAYVFERDIDSEYEAWAKAKAAKSAKITNAKYKGVSVIGTDGKTRMYIEQSGGYFLLDSSGNTIRLDNKMQNVIKSKGGLSKTFEKANSINDNDVSDMINKFKSRPSVDYELGNPFGERGKNKLIYRPQRMKW